MTRIGFDFDGVVCLTPFGRFAVHAPRPVPALPKDYATYYERSDPPTKLRVAIEYLRYAWRQPAPDAADVLRALAQRHELHIVTGRSDVGIDLVERWLRRHGLRECFVGIHMGPPGLSPPQHKLAVARMQGIDAHIDDDPRTAYYMAENGVGAVYLLDHAGAHGEAPLPDRITLVRSLREFAGRLDA